MHFSLLMEDYLEFEDWQDRENDEVTFNDSSAEERLMSKLRSTDHYFRKQGLTDLFLFLQHNTNFQNFPSIFEVLQRFSADDEQTLRCDFAESLITITKIMMSNTLIKWDYIRHFTIPCVINMLHDNNKQIRLASHATIVFMVENKAVNKELFFEEVYPTLEELMVSYNPDELRTECFTLLVQIYPPMEYCLEESLLKFCRDFINTNDNLRKTCASYLLNIITGSTESHLTEWLEIFYKLADDNSWYVKKFCIECAVFFSGKVSHEERTTKMTDVYYNFMTDTKKWVVTCAYQHFGAFVATFADPSKAFCQISDLGKVVTDQLTQTFTYGDVTPLLDTPKTNDRLSTDSEASFGNVFFWNQPVDNSFVPSGSPVGLSIKDIDINQSDSSDQPEYSWPPDLAKYKQDIIPIKLLQCYSNTIHEVCETDLIRQCAFSMPAVLVTLGPYCWPHLKGPYIKLIQFMSWKVRLSLASSLHHVFQIFKYNDSAVTDILWTFKELIKDVDEVKCGLMANLADFCLAIPISRYAAIFEDFDDMVRLDNVKNWRYRVTCMTQLELLITNVNLESQDQSKIFVDLVNTRWMNIISSFCEEQVWAVRISAADAMIATLKRLVTTNHGEDGDHDQDSVERGILDRIIRYGESNTWYLRQLFLYCAIKMVINDVVTLETLDTVVMPKFLYLCCWDKVPNNRMMGGHGLEQICFQGYFMSCSADMKRMMESVFHQLKCDKDRDVRQSVEKLNVIFVTVTP